MKLSKILTATLALHASVTEATELEADAEFFLRDLFQSAFGGNPRPPSRFGSFFESRFGPPPPPLPLPPPPPQHNPLDIIGGLIDDFIDFASRIRLGPGSNRGLGLRKRKTNKFMMKHLL